MKYTYYSLMLMTAVTMQCMQLPLSTDEKIGQLFMVATVADPENPISKDILFGRSIKNITSIKGEDELNELIRKYRIGSILFLGKSSAEKQYSMAHRLIEFNRQCNKIPLLVALDAEWGPAMRIEDATKFPFNITLGAIRDKAIIKEMGFMIGKMLQALRVGINFSPVADCNTNPLNPVINRRSFGENPDAVAACVQEYINGQQDAGIAACAKHFPGHGDTNVDSHTGIARVDHTKDRLHKVELIPFKKAIAANVKAIMTAHILATSIDKEKPATLCPAIMTDIVRKSLSFNGLLVTDALDMDAITKLYTPEESVLLALNAGNDMIVAPVDVPKAVERIKQALSHGLITMQEIDQHVGRILELKQWIELQKDSHIQTRTNITEVLNSKESQELSRRLFQKAITLVRNENILPIMSRSEHLSIIAIGTESIPAFANCLHQTNNCTIHLLPSKSTPQQYKDTALSLSGTIIIGLYGLTYGQPPFGITPEAQQFITDVCNEHKKVVIVLFGNPYALSLFPDARALIEAYEDHPFAQEAAARIIVGNLKPEGILPVTASSVFHAGIALFY